MWCTGARVRRHTAASSMHPLDAPRFLHCRPSRRPAMGGWNSHDDSLELWNSGELQTTHIRINRSFQAAIMVNALPKRVWVKIGVPTMGSTLWYHTKLSKHDQNPQEIYIFWCFLCVCVGFNLQKSCQSLIHFDP